MALVTVPVVFYLGGERRVVGEAVVDTDDYTVRATSEINLNDAGLSERKDMYVNA